MRSLETQLVTALARALRSDDVPTAYLDLLPVSGVDIKGVEKAAWLALKNWEADRVLFTRFPACRETSRQRMLQLIGRLEA